MKIVRVFSRVHPFTGERSGIFGWFLRRWEARRNFVFGAELGSMLRGFADFTIVVECDFCSWGLLLRRAEWFIVIIGGGLIVTVCVPISLEITIGEMICRCVR